MTTLVTLPVTGERLATATRKTAPEIDVTEVPDLETAVATLKNKREKFDTVILSPGAPSYNQFKNFEERGLRFVELCRTHFSDVQP